MARDKYGSLVEVGDIVRGRVLEKGIEVEKHGIVQRAGDCKDCQLEVAFVVDIPTPLLAACRPDSVVVLLKASALPGPPLTELL